MAPTRGLRDDRPVPTGLLYLVATPIGNLEDVTLRAARILAEVDLVAAEDTRRAGRLLQHLGIRRPLRSYYDAVECARAPVLVGELLGGKNIALVSDAGTPGIADPGYRLVAQAIAAGIRVVPVPGPSAITAFLPASGLATDRFAFEGFLPAKPAARRRRLEELARDDRTLLFYEAGRRLPAALADMARTFGARPAAIGRELTKLHEEIIRDDLMALSARSASLTTKGEVVIGVAGADIAAETGATTGDPTAADDAATVAAGDAELAAEIRRRRAAGQSVRDIAVALARERRLGRRTIYRLALALER
jgi:16S rRNA (cytidine1402-2'-O)-methyltransferase